MSAGVLPEDGEDLAFTIGLYGPGRRHRSQNRPVTWITDWTQTGAGSTWAQLSEKASETGLRVPQITPFRLMCCLQNSVVAAL
jgi:hypothetical protein